MQPILKWTLKQAVYAAELKKAGTDSVIELFGEHVLVHTPRRGLRITHVCTSLHVDGPHY